MSYLIIVIIMAVVLGPVMWLMPSAKQKQQMVLREHAMRQGLQIKMCDLPQSHRQKVRKEQPVKGVVYRLPLVSKRPITLSGVYCLKRVDGELEWQGQPDGSLQGYFEQALKQSPESVVAIELSAAGVACYWLERGGCDAVDNIKSTLTELREQLKGVYINE